MYLYARTDPFLVRIKQIHGVLAAIRFARRERTKLVDIQLATIEEHVLTIEDNAVCQEQHNYKSGQNDTYQARTAFPKAMRVVLAQLHNETIIRNSDLLRFFLLQVLQNVRKDFFFILHGSIGYGCLFLPE